MNRYAKLALPALLFCGSLTAQDPHHFPPAVELALSYHGASLEMRVENPMPEFLGAVLWSLNTEEVHSLQGLPPLLADSAVVGLGYGNDGHYSVTRSQRLLPLGIEIYAQGVVADTWGIRSTEVLELLAGLPER